MNSLFFYFFFQCFVVYSGQVNEDGKATFNQKKKATLRIICPPPFKDSGQGTFNLLSEVLIHDMSG